MTEVCKFAHYGAGNSGKRGIRKKEDGIDARELSIDIGHLLLIFKILYGTHATQDSRSTDGMGKICR